MTRTVRGYLALPGMRQAVDEMKRLIRDADATVQFTLGCGEDPPGLYLRAEHSPEVDAYILDVFIPRLTDIQVDERLPLYVFPIMRDEPVQHTSVPALAHPAG
jgi:hypothetical protein